MYTYVYLRLLDVGYNELQYLIYEDLFWLVLSTNVGVWNVQWAPGLALALLSCYLSLYV